MDRLGLWLSVARTAHTRGTVGISESGGRKNLGENLGKSWGEANEARALSGSSGNTVIGHFKKSYL